jgi:hypothetical protein
MTKLVKSSAGAMKATKLVPATDFLDFGHGKEDGNGTLSSTGSLRIDAGLYPMENMSC